MWRLWIRGLVRGQMGMPRVFMCGECPMFSGHNVNKYFAIRIDGK